MQKNYINESRRSWARWWSGKRGKVKGRQREITLASAKERKVMG